MAHPRRLCLLLAGWALLAGPLGAQFPQLRSLRPRGLQRGTEVELDMRGRALGGAVDLLFEREGLTLLSLSQYKDDRVVAHVAAAADAPLGPCAVWLRTATGLTNLHTLHVGALPEVDEAEPNGSLDQAQSIALDTTVNGIADDEDVDYFVFDGTAGERISIEVEGLRLGDANFDPYVALLDELGFALASCDDSAVGRRDPVLTVELPEDGRYLVQVRESTYRGNRNSRYRLHVGHYARPLALRPLGGAPGEELSVALLGAGGSLGEASIAVPDARSHGGWTPAGTAAVHLGDAGGPSPTPSLLRVSALPRADEVEPNDREQDATPVTLPAALEGVLQGAGDYDWFRFAGEKGDRFVAQVWARRVRSPVDSILVVRPVGGKDLASNDDDGGPDSRVRFELPKDGEYTIRLRDHLRRGGPAFAYRIEVAPEAPSLSLSIPGDREHVAVPRGGRAELLVDLERDDAGGALALSFDGLPEGVAGRIGSVAPGLERVLLLFEAAADAPVGQALVDVHAEQVEGPAAGGLRAEVVLVEGRNQTVLWAHALDRLPLAVTEPAPFTARVEAPGVPLVRNGRLDLEVVVERSEGWSDEVTLYLPHLPPGVSTVQGVRVAPGADRARVELHAGANARIGEWSLVLAAEADAPGSRVRTATAPVAIDVQLPIVAFSAQAVDVERGATAEMFVEIERPAWFRGAATVELVGLPLGVTSEPRELTAETEALVFPLSTTAESPTGKHGGLSFVAHFQLEGGTLDQGLSAAELRIQTPAPAVVATPPAVKPVEAAAPAEERQRPPTRLEKLRAQHATKPEAPEDQGGSEKATEGDS